MSALIAVILLIHFHLLEIVIAVFVILCLGEMILWLISAVLAAVLFIPALIIKWIGDNDPRLLVGGVEIRSGSSPVGRVPHRVGHAGRCRRRRVPPWC